MKLSKAVIVYGQFIYNHGHMKLFKILVHVRFATNKVVLDISYKNIAIL